MSPAVPRVAVLAFDAMSPFHLSVPCVVLGETYNGALPALFDVTIVTARPGRLTTTSGFDLVVEAGLSVMEEADVVVVPTADLSVGPDAEVVDAVRVAHARGARVVGLCHGAFTIAAAGLLDGRAAVTHWASAALLAKRHPSVQVRSDVLWIDHGDVLTSAGVAAALDCCLHLVGEVHGEEMAREVARRTVMAPHRRGGHAQLLQAPLASGIEPDPVEEAMAWAGARLDQPLDISRWSRAVAMSPRTLTRRFQDRAGVSPHQWLVWQRVDLARRLLETTSLSVEGVASAAGFGSAQTLRLHFRERLGTSPSDYRSAYAPRPEG